MRTCSQVFLCFEAVRDKHIEPKKQGAPGELKIMASFKEIAIKATAICMHFSITMMMMMMMMVQDSRAWALRPSDHGLEYQTMPPTGVKFPPEMKEFFGSSSAAKNTSASGVALPKAMNSNDTSWWRTVSGGGGGGKGGTGDHVRHVLLVASLVCGVTGLGLLVTSALIYYFIRHNNPSSSSSSTANNNHNRSITVYVGKN